MMEDILMPDCNGFFSNNEDMFSSFLNELSSPKSESNKSPTSFHFAPPGISHEPKIIAQKSMFPQTKFSTFQMLETPKAENNASLKEKMILDMNVTLMKKKIYFPKKTNFKGL